MKIAVWHNLGSGGSKRALYYHVRGLIEHGHHVEIWCPPRIDEQYLPLSELTSEHVIPWPGKHPDHRNIVAKMIGPYNHFSQRLKVMDAHARMCAKEIKEKNFDLLFTAPCHFTRISSIARYLNIPKVLYLQEPYRTLYEASPRLPIEAVAPPSQLDDLPRYLKDKAEDVFRLSNYRILAREEKRNAQAFDSILVNSYYSRESIRRAYGSEIDAKVCYLGIDTELFRPLNLQREPFIVSLGSFTPAKGVKLAIRAVSLLEEPRPKFVWIGNFANPSYLQEMTQLAKDLNVDLTVKIDISDQEVVELLNRASLMLYTPFLEPFGFAPLEANACGLPVVALAEGGVREVIKDGLNGLLASEAKPEIIAQAIQRLLFSPQLRKEIEDHAIPHVNQEWNLEKSILELEQCLLNSLESSG